MAELFLASVEGVEGFAKQLVIKCMLPELARDPEFVKMFVDEAKLAARLFHPDIVQVYELGVVNRRYFIAMEYVQGLDLAAFSRSMKASNSALPPGAVIHIGSAALRALHYAHEKKDDAGVSLDLVHRDVSPQNILISEEGVVKLTDFGIAKARNRSTKTGNGTLKGKFAYMAPEYAAQGEIDRRSDLFSIGMVLYELFAGDHPYHPDNEVEMLEMARAAAIRPLIEVKPGFPAALSAVMQKALAKDPAERFATAEAFGHALDENRAAFAAFSATDLGVLVSRLRAAEAAEDDAEPDDTGEVASETPARKARPGRATGVVAATPAVAKPPVKIKRSPLTLIAIIGAGLVLVGTGLWAGLRAPPVPPVVSVLPASLPVVAKIEQPASAPASIPAGYLTLNSSPWSEVWIDGKKLFRSTPLHNLQLPSGRHLVRLYSPAVNEHDQFTVDIEPGKTTTKIVSFGEK